jgi:carotenoid cleavage dioxygenase-like enzyme
MSQPFAAHAGNPYLVGAYAPIFDESVLGHDQLTIEGEIPADLNGLYVRNGPNPRFEPRGRYHWFDGDGMMHAMRFERGRVEYRNRWVRTQGFHHEDTAGHSLFTGLIEPDFKNPLGPIKDSANTDVIFHNGRLLALWYRGGEVVAVDPLSLETIGVDDCRGKLRRSVSAHAKVDPATGEMLFFHYGPKAPHLVYGAVSASGELTEWTPVEVPGERFPHDMGFTRHYAVLMDLPVFHNEEALRAGKWRQDFHPHLPSRFALVPRHGGGAVRWFEASPCYIYHVVNCWEDGDKVIMDACRVADPVPARTADESALSRMMKQLQLRAVLWRWEFDLKTGQTREGPLDDLNSEFPSINNDYAGKPSRFAYNTTIPLTDTLLFDGIVKYDTHNGKSVVHRWGEGCYGSESPFAPADNATNEDDGYLVSFVHDTLHDRSECRILDARDIAAGPVARVMLPRRVPLGYHATWVKGSDLAGVRA